MARTRKQKPGVDVAVAEKKVKALALRGQAYTYARIGAELGVSDERARQLVEEGLAEMVEEPSRSARNFEIRRMKSAAMGLEKSGALDGDPKAVAALCKVSERLAKLQGLDAPTKVDATVKGKPITEWTMEELMAARASTEGKA